MADDNFGLGKMTKPGDGYFYAKREMQEALERRIIKVQALRDKTSNENHQLLMVYDAQLSTLEEVRKFVRNVMLWDTRKDS